MEIKIQTLKCLRCGHEWIPRKPKVHVCPACHSYKWNDDDNKEGDNDKRDY